VGTSSNYSIVLSREPIELLLTASGMDKGRLRREDFVRVAANGQPTAPGQPKSSAETMLHVMLARRPDVGAVLHTHSIWGTLLSDIFVPDGGLEIAGYEMLKGLEGVKTHEHAEWVPIFENSQDIPAMADQVQRRIFADERQTGMSAPRAPVHGFLIRRHGLYTWGRNLEEARRHVEIFEFLFECVGRRMQFKD
jgi:methylthioribulose-1-phosphate dehydratase